MLKEYRNRRIDIHQKSERIFSSVLKAIRDFDCSIANVTDVAAHLLRNRDLAKHVASSLLVRRSCLRSLMEFYKSLDYRVESGFGKQMLIRARLGIIKRASSSGILLKYDDRRIFSDSVSSNEALELIGCLRAPAAFGVHRPETLATVRESPDARSDQILKCCQILISLCENHVRERRTFVLRTLQHRSFSKVPEVVAFVRFVHTCRFRSVRSVWKTIAGADPPVETVCLPLFLRALKEMGYPGDGVKLAACVDSRKRGVIPFHSFLRMFQS